MVRYVDENLVLLRRKRGAIKQDFRLYIPRHTSPNENFEYGFPHYNALLQFPLKLKHCNMSSNEM